jgi:selenocysteine lyase/cysteine desulfurase
MTLPAPLPRSAFSLEPGLVYLNHAAVGVLPNATRDAVVDFAGEHARRGVLGILSVESHLAEFRERVGRFVGARADEIAFLRNTGDGANVIARGLDWSPGDEIVLCANEFGSNALPWLALREYGVVVRFVDAPRVRLTPEVLQAAMSPRTRVVAVSWVSFADGYRHDLAALAEIAHARGAWFCVDAIQALGAFGLDVRASGIDALYAGGAKWLMALQGVSFLYVSRELQDRLTVRWRGWKDVADIWNFLEYDQPFAPDASRFEGGTQNFIGILSLDRSMAVLAEAGLPRIEAHVLALTDRLVEGLLRAGAELDTPRGAGISSGIVTFRLPGADPVATGRRLGAARIVTTFRTSGVRVAPHGYNTFDEIDALLEALGP